MSTDLVADPILSPDAGRLAATCPAGRPALLRSQLLGLAAAEAARRLALYGPNQPLTVERRHPAFAFLANFIHTLALLLWFAAGLSFATGAPQLGGAIVAVIIVNGIFAFIQEHRAEQVVQSLMRQIAVQASVLRDGAEQQLPALDLVPGDVVKLAAGEIVPADCVLLVADNLTIDLSLITGETLPVERSANPFGGTVAEIVDLPSILPAGSAVATGTATALVWATGQKSMLAGVAALVAGVHRGASALERQVATLARMTVIIAVLAGAFTLTVARFRTQLDFITVLTFATGVIVALVPEGLLPALSVSLAIGARRMAERGAAVRRLSAVEVVGSVTVICTDKTGTLTQNRLTVLGLVPAADEAGVREAAQLAGALCNDARTVDGAFVGDPLDVALATWLSEQGAQLEALRTAHPRLRDLPFNAERRYMKVSCQVDGTVTEFIKGAPEEVLSLEEDTELPADLAAALAEATSRGERVLLLAGGPEAQPCRVLGLIRFYDPARPEVPAAIAACHRAGVRVVMLTGDHPTTAQALAASVGLGARGLAVITGAESEKLSDGALLERLRHDAIFARTSPAQKLRLVQLLRRAGEVVVVTGDGSNDAPALRAADVGVAMGVRGTEVAKQAADIVLADDNFSTIVAAIEEGRAIKANIRRFVSYVFTSNVAQLVPFLAFLLLRVPLALTIMQALGISIGTDLLPALALGAEPPSAETMQSAPEPPRRPLLTRAVGFKTFLLFGPLEAVLGLAAFLSFYLVMGWRPFGSLAPYQHSAHQAATLTFLGVVGGQVGCLLAQRDGTLRSRLSLFANGWIARGLLFELSLTLLLVYVPGLNGLFSMTAVPLPWLLAIPVAAAVFLSVDLLRRALQGHGLSKHASGQLADGSGAGFTGEDAPCPTGTI